MSEEMIEDFKATEKKLEKKSLFAALLCIGIPALAAIPGVVILNMGDEWRLLGGALIVVALAAVLPAIQTFVPQPKEYRALANRILKGYGIQGELDKSQSIFVGKGHSKDFVVNHEGTKKVYTIARDEDGNYQLFDSTGKELPRLSAPVQQAKKQDDYDIWEVVTGNS